MLPDYSHTKSESLAQISTPMAEIQIFFLGDCFLLAHPVLIVANWEFLTQSLFSGRSDQTAPSQ